MPPAVHAGETLIVQKIGRGRKEQKKRVQAPAMRNDLLVREDNTPGVDCDLGGTATERKKGKKEN